MNVFKVHRSASRLRAMHQPSQSSQRTPVAQPQTLANPDPTDNAPSLKSWKRLGKTISFQLWQMLLNGDQPQVKWWRDRQGHDHYQIYDPVSQSKYQFETAQEVRIWLEQRYYR